MHEHFPPKQGDEQPAFTNVSSAEALNEGLTLREAVDEVGDTIFAAHESVTALGASNNWVAKKEGGGFTTVASPEAMATLLAQAMNSGDVSRLVELKASRGGGQVVGILHGIVPSEAVYARPKISTRYYGGCDAMLTHLQAEPGQISPDISWPTRPDLTNPQAFWVEAIGLPQTASPDALIAGLNGSTPLGGINPQGEFLDWNTVLAKIHGSTYRTS
jgi:hypothetical protein